MYELQNMTKIVFILVLQITARVDRRASQVKH